MTDPRHALAAAVVVTALVVQLCVLSRLPLPGATPDAVMLVVVALAFVHGPRYGTWTGFGAGLALDLAPPADTLMGQWAFVLTLVGFLAGYVESSVDRSALVPLAVVAIAAAGSLLLYAALGGFVGDPRVSWQPLLRLVPTAVLYDLVLAPFVLFGVVALTRRVEPEPLWGPGELR